MNNLIAYTDTSMQLSFNWDEKIAETRALIAEDTQLTSTIEDAMIRRFEVRVRIGFNLIDLQGEHSKNGHGDFTTVVLPELGITDRVFAHRCIRVAKLSRNPFVANLQRTDIPAHPMSTWNELAAPSTTQTVIEQALTGEIDATPQAIRDARDAQKRAEEAERAARDTEKTARQQLTKAQSAIDQLQEDMKRLQAQKQEDTPETKEKLKKLQEQLDKTKEQRDNLSKEAEKLGTIVKEAALKEKERVDEDRRRKQWRTTCVEFNQAVLKMLSQFPTAIDTQIFESEDWNYLHQAKETAYRFIAQCDDLNKGDLGIIIDAEIGV